MTILASFEGKGVPPDTYQVVLSELIQIPQELQPTEADFMAGASPEVLREQADKAAKAEAFLAANRKLPAILCDAKSPLELTVSESGGSLEIDVAQYR